ncbi:hypothetical protein [Rugosimonospora africana]|uniref:Uncharacterized protein n=1 Tax=Rugosimonospora africana TaxID=556532 RepID=A0A8J3QTA0_9ACTN|nr:hypothetical protein [Rugosimonospora africana]GIH15607.1 hypothetical protein Raf01_37790 [Rugosimonospora africana]
MKLTPRFALDSLFLTGGVFLLVSSMAFAPVTAGRLAFGVATGLAVVAGLSAILARGTGQKVGHGILAAAGLWSLIAALTFTGTTLTWLVFADAIGLAAVALADLAGHEVTTERVVHELVVKGTPAEASSQPTLVA